MRSEWGGLSEAQADAAAWVEDRAASFSADHLHLWRLAEPSWREYRSAAWFVERLRAEGFAVEAGTAGMPTAFAARWTAPGTERGAPVLATIAEYDAVPGASQEAVARRAPAPTSTPRAIPTRTRRSASARSPECSRRRRRWRSTASRARSC